MLDVRSFDTPAVPNGSAAVGLEALQLLAQQWQTFDTVLSNMPDHAYTLDMYGRFTYANKALLTRLQKTRAEVLGRSFLELGYPPDLAALVEQQIKQDIDASKPVRHVTARTLSNGETRYYDYIFVPVIGAGGQVEAVAGSTRDVTEQRTREEELRKANRELEEFAYVASHDLQEPLRMINIYTHLMMRRLPGAAPGQFYSNVTGIRSAYDWLEHAGE